MKAPPPPLIATCFSAPLERIWGVHVGPWLGAMAVAGGLDTWESPLDLDRVRPGELRRGGATPTVAALYSPRARPDTTVLLTRSAGGWYTLAHGIATRTPGRHVSVRSISEGEQLHHLTVWADGSEVRTVLVNQDPRWTFFERGAAQGFEDPARYERRLKRERLDRALLARYLAALGWNVDDPAFWETSGDARWIAQRSRATDRFRPG